MNAPSPVRSRESPDRETCRRTALSRRRAASAKIRRLKEWSGRCDRRLPRVHSRSTKRVMGLG
jgi:hypothetical protein